MSEVYFVLGEVPAEQNRIRIVIVSVFASVYQGRHKAAGDRSVFELVATRANGHIEPGQ